MKQFAAPAFLSKFFSSLIFCINRHLYISRLIYLTIPVVISNPAHSQNLVPNPSFEAAYYPVTISDTAQKWRIIELWDDTAWAPYSSPWSGLYFIHKAGKTGNIFAKIYVLDNTTGRHTYLQAALCCPLTKDVAYSFSMYVKPRKTMSYTTSSIGVLFSDTLIDLRLNKHIDRTPQIQNDKSNFFTDRGSWQQVTGTYVANGMEKYIIIGNFNLPAETPVKRIPKTKKQLSGLSLLIDDIVLTPNAKDHTDCCLAKNKQSTKGGHRYDRIETGRPYILNNVFFEFNESTLTEQSYDELDSLIVFLGTSKNTKITIIGHTDSIGGEKHNLELSEARAGAVAEYLILKGTDRSRIIYKGMGSSLPISSNQTEEGRTKNRRVEFIISNQDDNRQR